LCALDFTDEELELLEEAVASYTWVDMTRLEIARMDALKTKLEAALNP